MSDKMLTGCEAAFFLSACLVAPSPVSLSLNYIIKANFNAKINNSDEIMSQSVSALWPFFYPLSLVVSTYFIASGFFGLVRTFCCRNFRCICSKISA